MAERVTVYLSLEELDEVESPIEGESLFHLWVQAEGWENDCFEFSAPSDLLRFTHLTPSRLAWIQAEMAAAVVGEQSMYGHWDQGSLQGVLDDRRMVVRMGAQPLPFPAGLTLSALHLTDEIIRAARLDQELPAPAIRPSKPRF